VLPRDPGDLEELPLRCREFIAKGAVLVRQALNRGGQHGELRRDGFHRSGQVVNGCVEHGNLRGHGFKRGGQVV
jgi:hypothetical protein